MHNVIRRELRQLEAAYYDNQKLQRSKGQATAAAAHAKQKQAKHASGRSRSKHYLGDASVGERVDSSRAGRTVRTRWVTDGPIRNASFNLGLFKGYDVREDGIPPVTVMLSNVLVDIIIDADNNPSTGSPASDVEAPGGEYAIEMFGGEANLYKWDGQNYSRRANDPPQSSLTFNQLSISINSAELGNTKQFSFDVTIITGVKIVIDKSQTSADAKASQTQPRRRTGARHPAVARRLPADRALRPRRSRWRARTRRAGRR